MKTTKLVATIVIHANEIDNIDIRKANIFWKEKSTEIYMSEGISHSGHFIKAIFILLF